MTDHTCSETCGCCGTGMAVSPRTIDNRPGLDAIDYRIGTHGEFKSTLAGALSSSAHPALRHLRTRDDSDFSVALCDAVAVMADTLTFYQERIANEAYLRTATETRSIHELAALIGYRPAPGVAAHAYLAFKVEEAPGAPDQAPRSVTIPRNTRVQSVPAAGEPPVNFETMTEITGRPEWNSLKPRQTERHFPVKSDVSVVLAGVGHNLDPGDVMLFVGDERINNPRSHQWLTRVIKTVVADPSTNRTIVAWQPPIGDVHPVENTAAFVFRQRAAIFGHSAPDWSGQPDTYKASYMGIETPDQLVRDDRFEWPYYDIYAPNPDRRNTYGRFVTPKPDDVVKALDEAVKAALLAQGQDMLGSVVGAAGATGNAVAQPLQHVAESVGSLFEAASLVPGALQEVWNETLKSALDLTSAAAAAGTNFGSQLTNIGSNLGASIEKGIKDAFGL